MKKRSNATNRPHFSMAEMAKDIPWFEVGGHEKVPAGKRPKFSGPLNKPIVQSIAGMDNIDEVMNRILEQRIDKLILLLKHYKIESASDPWLLLSLRLACACVPGLRVSRRGRGQPAKWTGEMVAAVKAEMGTSGGVAKAITDLKQKDPDRYKGLTESRYYEVVRRDALRKLTS